MPITCQRYALHRTTFLAGYGLGRETLGCQRCGALRALLHGRSRVDDVGLGFRECPSISSKIPSWNQSVDVKSGVTVNGKTEVFGDLKPGDLVVRNATDSIRSDASVEAHEK
jgi:hypothetical protein